MSIQLLKNSIRNHAATAADVPATTKQGQISGYNPNNCTVKVQFLPDETETGWIPLGSPWVGDGWGMCCGPSIGDQVTVEFQDGAQNAPVAMLRVYDATNVALGTPSGEFWLVHKSGAFFKLLNAGGGIFSDGQGAFVQLNGNGTITSGGTWTHQGALTVENDLTVQGSTAVSAITSNNVNISSTHKHGGVTTGSGETTAPNE